MNPRKKALLETAERLLVDLKSLSETVDMPLAERREKGEKIQADLKSTREEIEGINYQESLQMQAAQTDQWINGLGTQAKVIGRTAAGQTEIDEAKGHIEHTGYGLISEAKMTHLVQDDYKKAFTAMIVRGGVDRISSADLKVLQEGIDDEGGCVRVPTFAW
jgi:predicted phage gp36 major capsid-like protein